MNKILLSSTLFFAISLAVCSQSQPTEEETAEFILNAFSDVKWLVAKNRENALMDVDNGKWYWINSQIDIQNCTCKLTRESHGSSGKEFIEFSFGNLSPKRIAVSTQREVDGIDDPMYYYTSERPVELIHQINLETYLGRELIQEVSDGRTSKYSSLDFMHTPDEELANRMVEALRHLTKLCGGKDGF